MSLVQVKLCLNFLKKVLVLNLEMIKKMVERKEYTKSDYSSFLMKINYW